jgi:hypothetical protein
VSAGETAPAAVARANLALVMAFSWLFLTPLCLFWGAVWGPTRPSSYPADEVAPAPLAFCVGLALCFLPCALPTAYYRAVPGQGIERVLTALGVRTFKRFATNGDLVNRWARRRDPYYRVVRDVASATEWARQAREAERNHLVFLSMATLSIAYAAWIGWYGWALGLMGSNVVFNVYPILLQRYNQLRIARILKA